MANPSPQSPPSQSSILLLFLLLISSAAYGVSSTTTFQEFEIMTEALRNHGYTLFTNAITTSDLQYQLLNTIDAAAEAAEPTSPFTLFAPVDELLFALDMASDAAVYVNTLRYHVIPNHRHTFADLQNLSSPFLDTLLPHYSVLIGKTQDGDVLFDNASVGVMVDAVRLSDPDLYLGSRIAVHGIDGILLTGLNMNQDFDGNDNGSGIFSPVESPAPSSGLDRNIPAEGTLSPMSQFDWNNVLVAPASLFDGNIPMAAPPRILQDQTEKSLVKNKRGKRHRRARRHRGLRRHRPVDL
ncbi:hypothetical protein Pfo_018633 [Paulownia fortunei]|nr:hypothetical protein Pfo_018633 [Paulownia fortunei]